MEVRNRDCILKLRMTYNVEVPNTAIIDVALGIRSIHDTFLESLVLPFPIWGDSGYIICTCTINTVSSQRGNKKVETSIDSFNSPVICSTRIGIGFYHMKILETPLGLMRYVRVVGSVPVEPGFESETNWLFEIGKRPKMHVYLANGSRTMLK